MNIFLTGASGYIGGSVALALREAGHRVRGLTRDERTAGLLAASGIEAVIGSIDDADLLSREASAADAVIHTASADHAPSAHALIDALAGSGKALLHTSGSSIVADDAHGDRLSDVVVDEDTPLVVHPLKQARRDIDLAVLEAAGRGVRSVVICPGLVYGVGRGLKRDSVQVPFLAANARGKGIVEIVGSGRNVWSNVHLDDLVPLYLLALKQAPAGSFYFAENGESSFRDLGDALAGRLGLPGVASVPVDDAVLAWGEARARFSFGGNSRMRANRARRELGWSPSQPSLIDWIKHDMPID
jgi:nucleoside-diphosphate-sugar epimerase